MHTHAAALLKNYVDTVLGTCQVGKLKAFTAQLEQKPKFVTYQK